MAWTAGVTRSTGDLISAADWNNYLGASGSLDYLKTETDKIDDCSYSDVKASRAFETDYQNSTSIRFVAVSIQFDPDEYCQGRIGSASPGTIVVDIGQRVGADATEDTRQELSFFVPPSWYYDVHVVYGTPTIEDWGEWDLH